MANSTSLAIRRNHSNPAKRLQLVGKSLQPG
jgi:hypothetical protein